MVCNKTDKPNKGDYFYQLIIIITIIFSEQFYRSNIITSRNPKISHFNSMRRISFLIFCITLKPKKKGRLGMKV